MASIWDWSKTAGNNDTADSDINFQENQVPSTVNNSCRQVMGRAAEILDDLGAVTSTTNLLNAYTLTANSAFTALADGLIVGFKASATNTGAATLNVNALGTKAIRRIGATADVAIEAGVIVSGQKYLAIYDSAANAAAGAWMLLRSIPDTLPNSAIFLGSGGTEGGELRLEKPASGSTLGGNVTLDVVADSVRLFESGGTSRGASLDLTSCAAGVGSTLYHSGNREIPAGTRMIFYQAAAPTGWTQVTDAVINDRAMRITTGAGAGLGGWVDFTTVFARTATDAHTLTTAEMPVHSHTGTTGLMNSNNVHSHTTGPYYFRFASASSADFNYLVPSDAGFGSSGAPNTSSVDLNHTHNFTTANAGSGGSHTHNMDIRVKYIDVIVCSRD